MHVGSNRDIQLVNADDSAAQGITLRDFFSVLLRSRWLIVGFVLAFALGGLLHVLAVPPIYRTEALLQVNQQAGIGGLSDFSELAPFMQAASIDTEMEILKSRAVVGEVVDKYDLDIVAEPVYFPVAGAKRSWFDNLKEFAGGWLDVGAWLNLNNYAWGDVSIDIERLDVPPAFFGATFTLTAGENGIYQIHDSEGRLLAEGMVGVPNKAWLPTDEPHALLVSELEAHPGAQFEVSRKGRLKAIDDLRDSLEISPGTEEETAPAADVPTGGLLFVGLEGKDPQKITALVNETIDVYIEKNATRRAAAVEATLEQLHAQIPKIKAELERAEAELVEYRTEQGSVDIPLQTESVFNKMVALETELEQLTLAHDRLAGRYTARFTARREHVENLEAQIAAVKNEKAALEAQVNRLPNTQQGILRLQRDVEVNRELYTLLLNKEQQLQVLSAGAKGNVSVIDEATLPVEPSGPPNLILAAAYPLLGFVLSVGVIFLRRSLVEESVEDPEVIEKQLGLPVYAVVPHSDMQDRLSEKFEKGKKHTLLSANHADDVAVESVRGLRTWLNFAFLEAKNNALLITGPAPGVGKSFLSANLAYVMANAGKKVLIIDADMRKGHLHRYFDIDRAPGLSDVLEDMVQAKEAIHSTATDKLFVMPTGPIPKHPSELLQEDRFASVLQEFADEFDYVLIDSPPILAVTDATTIGRLTAGALLVVMADAHPLRELQQSVKTLRRSGTDVLGVVFNDMDTSRGSYGYGKYYGYAYSASQ
jgi:tyrosine-protein kinase Etk/Wzc